MGTQGAVTECHRQLPRVAVKGGAKADGGQSNKPSVADSLDHEAMLVSKMGWPLVALDATEIGVIPYSR